MAFCILFDFLSQIRHIVELSLTIKIREIDNLKLTNRIYCVVHQEVFLPCRVFKTVSVAVLFRK